MFQNVGSTEIVIIAAVAVLLFGGKRIPEFFKGMGEAVREFKKAAKDDDKKEKK